MLSTTDGEELIAAIEGGESVTVTMGALPGGSFELSTFIFTTNSQEVDPIPENNGHSLAVMTAFFADGFESGDLSGWSHAES